MATNNSGNNRPYADIIRKAALLVLLSVFVIDAHAATDSLRTLRGVDVVARQPASGLRRRGNVTSLSSSALLRGMRMLGTSDAIGALRLSPGVGSGSDYASGLSVNGAPVSQSAYLIDGMPVFFPFHFGGIFSSFNTPHFKRFSLDMTGNRPDAPMRAGAIFEASSADERPDSLTGVVDLGLISSSLTVMTPAGPNTMAAASVRSSYIDLLAPALIDNDRAKVRYSFTDANLTIAHRPDSANLIKLDGFYTTDHVRYTDRTYNMHTTMRWVNALGGALWSRTGRHASIHSRLSVSHSGNRFGSEMPQLDMSMLAAITQLSAFSGWSRNDSRLRAGAGTDYTIFTPQHLVSASSSHTLRSFTGYVFSTYRHELHTGRFAEASLRLSLSSSSGRTYVCADPRLTIERVTDTYTAGIDLSVKSQYVQQVGFSDIGMSADFWLPATDGLKPMRTAGIDIRYRRPEIIRGMGLNASVFTKFVYNESEYQGMLTDILAPGYDALGHIRQVNGYNIGGDIMLDINLGQLSGWAGYSLAVCRRKYPECPGRLLPSASEPLHSLKLLGEYSLGGRWRLSAYFTLATGRRYTPVEAVYAIGGNILIDYGDPYSASMPLYHRLDLSATCNLSPLRIGRRQLTNFITLSLINAYGHRNAELTTINYDTAAAAISRDYITSLYRYLPSISYTLRF